MKVIAIGTDVKLFDDGSAVLTRNIEYASKMEEMHIVVCTQGVLYQPKRIGNLYIYPTNSGSKFMWPLHAYNLGKKVIIENKFIRGLSVISAQDPFESGLAAYLLSRRFRLPLQLQIHTDFLSMYFKNSFLNRIRVIIARYIVPKAHGLRVVSEHIATSLRSNFSYLRATPRILPIFVDIEAILKKSEELVENVRSEFSEFNFILFMASRLTEEKNISIALEAVHAIISDFPHIGLVISGDGKEKSNLESKVKKLGLEKNVIFIGWQEDLFPYYKASNIFLLTSIYEGYGMTLVEAAASGVPIITTDVGIAKKIIVDGENSFICPVGDVQCFANHIKDLISDNQKRELFKLRLQDSIKSIAVSRTEYVAEYVRLLESLLKPV